MNGARVMAVRTLLCLVGRKPTTHVLLKSKNGVSLDAMQVLVGGMVQCVTLDDGQASMASGSSAETSSWRAPTETAS